MSEKCKGRFSEFSYFGFILPTPPIEKPKAEPVEKPDPYPSRAGWRADYLSPHDPRVEEPSDKPKGKIGEYEIIDSATTFEDIGGNAQVKGFSEEHAINVTIIKSSNHGLKPLSREPNQARIAKAKFNYFAELIRVLAWAMGFRVVSLSSRIPYAPSRVND